MTLRKLKARLQEQEMRRSASKSYLSATMNALRIPSMAAGIDRQLSKTAWPPTRCHTQSGHAVFRAISPYQNLLVPAETTKSNKWSLRRQYTTMLIHSQAYRSISVKSCYRCLYNAETQTQTRASIVYAEPCTAWQ